MFVVFATCKSKPPTAAATPNVTIENVTDKDAVVFIAFGSDSALDSSSFSFCSGQPKLNCSFVVQAKAKKALDTGGKYLNATVSYNAAVGCGSTKAELNLNNPKWYDITDVSLVDGFSDPITMLVKDASGDHTLAAGSSKGNEKAFGVYPLGCDICVARQTPPCGQVPGKDGCKGGDQYHPDVPCQYQGSTMSGGSVVTIMNAVAM